MGNEKEENPVSSQWALLNRALIGYKWVSITLGLTAGLLALLLYRAEARPPIVVFEHGDQKQFHAGERISLKITDEDVKQTIEQWVLLRYAWKEFDPERIAGAIGPLSAEGLTGKVRDLLVKEKAHSPPEQHLSETVSGIEVSLGEKSADAAFDLILRINGIPVVIPSKVSFQVVEGERNHWNPLGLYINGVVEHERK